MLKWDLWNIIPINFFTKTFAWPSWCFPKGVILYQFLIMDHYVKKTNLGCLYHSHAVASGPWATDPIVWGCDSGGPPAIRSLPCFCKQIYLATENTDRSTRRCWAYCPTDHWPAGLFAVGCCSTPPYHCLQFWCRAGSNCQKEVGQSSWPFTFMPLHFSNFQLCLDYTHFVQLILFTSVFTLWNCYEGLNPEGMQHLIGAGR